MVVGELDVCNPGLCFSLLQRIKRKLVGEEVVLEVRGHEETMVSVYLATFFVFSDSTFYPQNGTGYRVLEHFK